MPSGTAGSSERLRTPLALSLQRGTTIIRCTPPKAFVEPKAEDQRCSKYYDDVRRRRDPAPPLPGDSRHDGLWGPARHQQRAVPWRDPAPLRQTKAFGLAGMIGGTPREDSQPPATVEERKREASRMPSRPVSEADSRYSAALDDERGDEDDAANFVSPEPPLSPKVVVDWDKTCSSLDGKEPSAPASYSTDEAVLRGYIGIAHALLRHFEEALGTRQRITAGSLECAETVCKALNSIQDSNPRFQLLAQRIATAIDLLHRRKTLEDRDAAERGVIYGEVEFPYSGVEANYWPPVPRVYASPFYIGRSSGVDLRPASPLSLQHTQEEGMNMWSPPKCCTSFPFQTVQCGTRQQRRIAGPPTPKVAPVRDAAINRETYPETPLQVEPSPQRQCEREVERRSTRMEDTAIAVPSGKRGNFCSQSSGSVVVSGDKEGMTCRPSTGTSSVFLQADQLRKTSATEASSLERPYNTLESTGKPAVVAPVLSSSNARTRSPQSAAGIPRTQLAGPHLGGMTSNANQTHRAGCTGLPFRELEGNLHVRPLVLSETHVLTDKDNSQWKEDPTRASAVEALALIRCAIGLIVSGEGPGFVEKQFFRYFRPDSYQREVDRPLIPEGMTPAQGKYLLLCYAIARVEAEYGADPAARDTHLYLRDLRRMEEIIANPSYPQGKTSIESHDGNEGQESQRPQSAHSLPERSPEERMERHLPLTILTLPSSSRRQVTGEVRREQFPPVHSPMHSEGTNCVSPGPVSEQPMQIKKENSFGSASSATPTSPQLSSISLPKPLPSLGGSGSSFEKLPTADQPTGSSTGQVGHPLRASSSSSLSAVLTGGLPDVPTATERWESEPSNSSTSSRQVTLPTPTLARATSSATIAQSTAPSGLLELRKNSSSLDKVSERSTPSGGGSRSKLLMPKGSLDSIMVGEEGLKLSTRSVVRDSLSGEVASVVFEPPKNTAGQSLLDTATSAAMKEIALPRSPGLAVSASYEDGKA
ncbi:uncharacterized protein EMH_0049030 [Eimeria mitis]|uniref:Uncharacterized protein n=1 Tax=Eimeria mitis TaxID=44415 RepID=U6KD89_9EIME|nr:uncharacterized protein EMH_0049030 [Eimeria mitis]CDJ35980.1 hypothetical protein, conserved [Eimeria mitis]